MACHGLSAFPVGRASASNPHWSPAAEVSFALHFLGFRPAELPTPEGRKCRRSSGRISLQRNACRPLVSQADQIRFRRKRSTPGSASFEGGLPLAVHAPGPEGRAWACSNLVPPNPVLCPALSFSPAPYPPLVGVAHWGHNLGCFWRSFAGHAVSSTAAASSRDI